MHYDENILILVLRPADGVSACIYFMMGPASLNSIRTFPRLVTAPL